MQLQIRQPILLSSQFINNEKKYSGYIYKIDKDFLTIEFKNNSIEIPSGTPLKIIFWDENSIYAFETITILPKKQQEFLFNIQKPTNIIRTFKRMYKRIDIKLDTIIFNINKSSSIKGIIEDLSAGGARIVAPKILNIGDPIKMSFVLPDGERFEDVGGMIIRAEEINSNLADYGVEFSRLSEIRKQKLNDFIIKYSLMHEHSSNDK